MKPARYGRLSAILLSCALIGGCSDERGGGAASLGEGASAIVVSSPPSGDTYVRLGPSNTNFGTASLLAVAAGGRAKALVQLSPAAMTQAIGTAPSVTSAVLQLSITQNGASGQTQQLEIHRMTTPWTEADATWSCAIDANLANAAPDCSGQTSWQMGAGQNPWSSQVTGTITIAPGQSGVVSVDVTADVNAFLSGSAANHGWVIFRSTGVTGFVTFGSRESSSPPAVVLDTGNGGGAGGAGGGSGTGGGGAGDDCVAQSPCHLPGVLDPLTGLCTNPAASNGTPCNDGDACTDPDTCQSGVCVGTLPQVCGSAGGGQGPGGPTPECAAPVCQTVNPTATPSLVMTRATHPNLLSRFSLNRVLTQLIAQAQVANTTPLTLFQRWWDTQNTTQGGTFADVTHCDASGSTVNGFPVDCPRPEGVLAAVTNPFTNVPAGNPDLFLPVALFNRFDLARTDGSTCGEFRIIFARQGGLTSPTGRVLLNFEGELPNPNPGCGLDACRPVAELLASLSTMSQAAAENAVESFYFNGLPGFRPVVHPSNYGMTGDSGVCGPNGGQIRTNQFLIGQQLQFVWQLHDFKLDRSCAGSTFNLDIEPAAVIVNPFGPLFSPNPPPLGAAFQADFINEVSGLAASSVTDIHMDPPGIYNAGRSNAQGTENDYGVQLGANNAFSQAISNEVIQIFGSPALTARNIADRATTQSCAGCHQLSNGVNLGGGLVWPSSLNFVHVNENGQLSTALTGTFLPHRLEILTEFLACMPMNIGMPSLGGSMGQ